MLETLKNPRGLSRKTSRDVTIDNQQVSSTELAWLAGLLDGEGTINISRKPTGKRKDGSIVCNYWVFVQFVNTNEEVMTKVIDLQTRLGAKPYVWHKPPAKTTHRAAIQTCVQNMGKAEKILRPILPYLVGKKRHAELVLSFIEERKATGGRGKYNPYSKDQMGMIDEIKRLNFRGNLRDFVPESKRNAPTR